MKLTIRRDGKNFVAYHLEHGAVLSRSTRAKAEQDAALFVEAYGSPRRSRYLGINVARTILTGDVDLARRYANIRGRGGWNVPEARAIAAACRVARERFAGCSVSFSEFL